MLSKQANRLLHRCRTELTTTLRDTPSPNPNNTNRTFSSSSSTRRKGNQLRHGPPSEAASSLHRRLSAVNNESEIGVVLNEWISSPEAKSVTNDDILASVGYLRSFGKFEHALQLLEWTEKRSIIWLTIREHAKFIELIWKARGVEAAEKYFTELPESAKKKSTYGSLLHCLCNEKMEEKAMALFEKMRALNFPLNSFDYCSLMSLHMKLGQPEKVPLLADEMKQKGIKSHIFVYKLLINSYASLNDMKAVERVEEEIKTSSVIPDWSFYSNLSAIYIAAGLFEKAEFLLREIENLKLYEPRAFHFLLNLYASIGKAKEVNRIWESLKSTFPKTNNLSYLTMLQTLSRLQDMDGLKNCFEEWESGCTSYDVRLANVLIKEYLKRDMAEEAQSLFEHILKKGYELNFATYELFIQFFLRIKDMDSALKLMVLGTPHVRKAERKMYKDTAEIFQNYYPKGSVVPGAEEFYETLKQVEWLDPKVHSLTSPP